MTPTKQLFAIALGALLGSAQAHVTLEQGEAVAGSSYKAVFKVGHGCDGSATTRISVLLPDGFRGAKPVPKPGWTLAIRKDKLATPYESHGKTVTEDVVELSWTASSEASHLQDAWYDEFVLRGSLPQTPGPLWFKVRQSCQQGEWFWADLPASGNSTKGLKAPAVLLMLKKPEPAAEHQH